MSHLHYFTADTALATLKFTGHQVIDYIYTDSWRPAAAPLGRGGSTPFKNAFMNVLRWSLGKLSIPWATRLLGGYSLLVSRSEVGKVEDQQKVAEGSRVMILTGW